MPHDVRRRLFRFGVFEADEARGELRKHGVRVKLHAQPFQVLLMLLERPSELITREEMRRQLWGEDTFVDFDHSLNSAVNKIRDALNDSAALPRYVETVSGKGYRFIAPVSDTAVAALENAAPEPLSAPAIASHTPRSSVLSTPDELPTVSRNLIRVLLLMVETLYLGFYVAALANLREINEIFLEEGLPGPSALIALVITTAAVLIPVRLFLLTAVTFDVGHLPLKFARMFPLLLVFDLVWAVSPFLLIHHVNTGLALGMSAALVYLPFAQRSLVLMYGRDR